MAKAHFEKIPYSDTSFTIKEEEFPFFDIHWHLHPEFEIAWIDHFHSQRFVGDSIKELNGRELLFLGPYLPHSWISERQIQKKNKRKQTIIHFNKDFLGNNIWDTPEMKEIKELFCQSEQGIRFSKSINRKAGEIINQITHAAPFKKITLLLNLLHLLATSEDKISLSSVGFTGSQLEDDSILMNKIFNYIQMNFKEEMSLNQIASIFGMTPQYFCHFFKKKTKNTFISFLNDIRIGYACRLLIEEKRTITEICFESGFNNISNFNRRFKNHTGVSPREYKRKRNH